MKGNFECQLYRKMHLYSPSHSYWKKKINQKANKSAVGQVQRKAPVDGWENTFYLFYTEEINGIDCSRKTNQPTNTHTQKKQTTNKTPNQKQR